MNNDTSLETLVVEVSDIIYENSANGYTVFEFETSTSLETATGVIPGLYVGETLKISGQWTNHPTYGEQFKVVSFEKQAPSDSASMLKYLASGAIKGIGPKTAERIIDAFGDDTFKVLESSPEMLSTVKGISKARAQEITVEFNSQFGMRSVMIFFSEYFGPALSSKIYKRWGSASIDIVKANPYVLCNSISGIGFEKADNVASSFGYPKDSSERIEAGIFYVLKQDSATNGNLYLPERKLSELTANILEVDEGRVLECIESLCDRKMLIAYDFEKSTIAQNARDKAIYLSNNFHTETNSSSLLWNLSRFATQDNFLDYDKIINETEESEGIKYAPLQRNAIISALKNSVYILTGGPGTGKTTIIRAIIKIYTTLGLKYLLAAPTGRAAKRMSESTHIEARTIHRLLEYEFSNDDEDPAFTRDESNPLEADVVIIDEASMIDSNLFYSLLRAIRPTTRLLLIGDANQLPSVGAGNVLKDIISSGVFEVGTLNEIFRQENGSAIVLNAHKVNNGEPIDLNNKSRDFFFMPRDSASSVSSTIAQLYSTRLPAKYGEGILEDIQVLCPTKKSECGTIALNKLLQSIKNPPSRDKNEISVRDFILREGDKVMQIKNNYDIPWTRQGVFEMHEEGLGIFNGDIGTVEKIDLVSETVVINFDSRIVEYDFLSLDEIEHAYAVTIHKSQGSEYPVVIIPLASLSQMLMTRNLLYTAITRAQKMIILVGSAYVIERMIDNNTDSKRYTGLGHFLKKKNEFI